MDRSANVYSVEALKQLRTALITFESGARDATMLLALEVRRAVDWLENDRAKYWPDQHRKASEAVAQARNELERRQLTYGSEEPPSCYEQKKALERAKRRLRVCEEKIKAVQRWIRAVRSELNEFEGQMARMNEFLDADVPRAVAALDRMLIALEKYTATVAPPPSRGDAPAAAESGG